MRRDAVVHGKSGDHAKHKLRRPNDVLLDLCETSKRKNPYRWKIDKQF